MAREFVWKKRDGNITQPYSLRICMQAAWGKVRPYRGPFVLLQDGEKVKSGERQDVLNKLHNLLTHGDIGPQYRIRDGKGEVVFYCREVAPAIPHLETNGNEKADEFWSWVCATYPQYHPRYAGAYVCKYISGGGSMSQHSYGNAVDVFFDSIAHQEEVFHDIVAGKCPVPVMHTISDSHIWTKGVGVHGYGGNYHAHLHTDFDPSFYGSCGVRN